MICPKCGEDNSNSFRFCGMCGTVLEARRPTPAAAMPTAGARPVLEPTTDSLRERSFSGLDSFRQPPPARTGVGSIMLLVLLLMGLGAAAWWAYGNYIGVERGSKPAGTVAPESDIKPEKASTSSVTTSPAASDAEMPGSASEERGYTAKLPVQPTALPDGAAKNDAVKTEVKPEPKPIPATIARADRIPAKTTARPAAKPSSPVARPSAENTGEADFRKGEAYLYGRGMPENCDAAVKSLKAASAKENAKARSAFGTMYATGHCVTRDLPTSYLWFAMALRVDPNNQILEKDLNAVWNQMTPPERQMAMRMKQ